MKKLVSLLLAIIMVVSIITIAPISTGAATTLPSSIYITKKYSVTCTLASAVMMLRARTYLSGNNKWSSITEDGALSTAWINGTGLKGSFTYSATNISISVTNTSVSGISIASLKKVLDSHPEGIVLYCGNVPHAVFLTDYEGNTFYCADPDDPWSGTRRTLASSGLGYVLGSQSTILNNVTKYWYVSSYNIKNNSSYNIKYNANGGTGSIASSTVTYGNNFTIAKSGFTRTGYTLSGYNVYRTSDKRYYTSGGWATTAEINNNGYTKTLYYPGRTCTFDNSWTKGASAGDTYTFYAIWKQDTYNINYNPYGGTGTMSASTIVSNGTLTIPECKFTRDGYYFAGYNCYRKSDNTWYTETAGWKTNTTIQDKGYVKKVYTPRDVFTFGTAWTNGASAGDTFTFQPIWLKNKPVISFYDNISGSNYISSSLDNKDIFAVNFVSRDTSVHTLSIDTTETLNNQNSLKIVSTTAGSTSSKDFAIKTNTNDGMAEIGKNGDSRNLVISFYAKSDTEGTQMNLRWGYSTNIHSVTLGTQWKRYSVTMPKTIYYGAYIHGYLDRASTVHMNNIIVAEKSSTSLLQENGSEPIKVTYTPGETFGELPELCREGYTFKGWFTQNVGGTQIEIGSTVPLYDTNLYAQWEKDFSETPTFSIITPSGKLYEYYDNAVSWLEAKEHCESLGGHLVTINSEEENTIVLDLIKDSGRFAWIGASYNTESGCWEWVTGEEFEYTNWIEGEPSNNESNPEYYAQMLPFDIGTNDTQGKWNDSSGVTHWFSYYGIKNACYICEYETGGDEQYPTVPTENTEPTDNTEPTIEPPIPDFPLGDTDGDGEITILDATVIQRYLAQLPNIVFADICADTDKDGVITILDATQIQRLLAQIIEEF